MVFKLLDGRYSRNTLIRWLSRSKLSISDLTAALLALEMRDLVRALPGSVL